MPLPAHSTSADHPAVPCNLQFRSPRSSLDSAIQDTVLRSQIFVPQQQFLIDGAGDVGQHASPVHSRASLKLIVEPGLYMLLRFQKAAGRGNYETGNQAFSKCLRFLTIRGPDRERRDVLQLSELLAFEFWQP